MICKYKIDENKYCALLIGHESLGFPHMTIDETNAFIKEDKDDLYISKIKDKGCRRMRRESGRVNSDSKLVEFFYLLLRDYLPAGEVEEIMNKITGEETQYTNGWLAKLAENIATRLTE